MSAAHPTSAVMPAQAGIQLDEQWKRDSGLRRNDGKLKESVYWERTPHPSVMPAQAGIQLDEQWKRDPGLRRDDGNPGAFVS